MYKDVLGNPLLRVTVKYMKEDIERSKYGVEKCAEIVDVDVVPDDLQFDHKFYTDHFIGGVIMGPTPDNSAVNTYSQMWEMENLFVVGGSSFPHTSSYNPTGTIGAFAYRAAEGMITYLKTGGLLTKIEQAENA